MLRPEERQKERQSVAERRRTLLAWGLVAVTALLSLIGLLLPAGAPMATQAPTVLSTQPPTQPPTERTAPKKDDALLLLVNASHPLPEDYAPELTRLSDWDLSVASVCYDDLKAMLAAGRAEGLAFQICSAYRTRDEQRTLFEEDVRERMASGQTRAEAEAETARYTMRPGCSEHESGLALDIVALSNQLLDETQAQTGETRWLHAHSWEYGFILRYPEDKKDVTGISYESWHYRYVGREAAAELHELGLTLEEYLEN